MHLDHILRNISRTWEDMHIPQFYPRDIDSLITESIMYFVKVLDKCMHFPRGDYLTLHD